MRKKGRGPSQTELCKMRKTKLKADSLSAFCRKHACYSCTSLKCQHACHGSIKEID